jgi:hypothetical protein
MRLLEINRGDRLGFTNFQEARVPRYAILSHTWGAEAEEVTFQDLRKRTAKRKSGYTKIRFCGEQARRDGLRYFWVDTCCIDHGSDSELEEAINSMFKWYENATKCYVYLSDVSTPPLFRLNDLQRQSVFELFAKSRWFARGWTLPELLAPKSVVFFSKEGRKLGDKKSLEGLLCRITGIPDKALQGSPLSNFSINERSSWQKNRDTTREEDKYYSLLGIFDVHIPILYGEGIESAFRRFTVEIQRVAYFPRSALQLLHIQRFQRYRPLEDFQFRSLQLHQKGSRSEISCMMRELDLLKPPAYNALSYVWGHEPAVHRITVNNKFFSIRPNLFHALQRIIANEVSAELWVDSVCIDQSNEEEKGAQVRRMADIFKKAKNVWIWLGEEDLTSKAAMELIPKILNPHFRWDGVWWETHDFLAFDQLLTRPWFRRRWVIQEAAFSASSVILCGGQKVPMEHFTRAVSLVRSKLSSISESFGTIGKSVSHLGFLANFRDSPATRLLDIIEGVFDRSKAIRTRKLSLETLVELGTFCEATDLRDTIFALLNLANDADSMVPDYSSHLLDVFADFILHCSHHSGFSDIICRPWAPVSPFAARPVDQVGEVDPALKSSIPSWIVSRDHLQFGNPSLGTNHRLHGKCLVGSGQKRVYNAHYNTKPKVHLQRNEITNTCDGSLHAEGIFLGVITQISMRMAGGIITRECLDVLANQSTFARLNIPADFARQFNSITVPDFVWRTLCADRDSEGGRAPEAYHSAMVQLMQPSSELSNGNHGSSIDVEELLETDLPEHVKGFLEVARDVVWNRRTFNGSKHNGGNPLVGLIPRYAKAGDQLCIIYGCSVPVVLRKQRGENDHHYWQLIGEAYVHGHMDGEGISEMSPTMLESEMVEFEIR